MGQIGTVDKRKRGPRTRLFYAVVSAWASQKVALEDLGLVQRGTGHAWLSQWAPVAASF